MVDNGLLDVVVVDTYRYDKLLKAFTVCEQLQQIMDEDEVLHDDFLRLMLKPIFD